MKNKLIISKCVFIWGFILVGLVPQVYSQNPSLHTNSGDEQGLEIPKNMVLKQDKDAYVDALKTWYTDDLKKHSHRIDWFADAKFGCFIHWGVYSQLGGAWGSSGTSGYGEHIMRVVKIPLKEYREKVVNVFDAPDFDAEKWMKTAKETGMRYFIITAKHHDGFAMYPSNAYPYDIRLTKFKRDPMKELSMAAKKYGIKFGFYYSHAFDWEHPDAPGNDWDWDNPGGDKLLHGANWWENYPEFLPRAEKYVNEKSIPQILELIKNYQPDILWFDTPHKLPLYLNLRITKVIRDTDPNIVVNGRLAGVGSVNFGDYINTGDRAAFFRTNPHLWEAIPTTNESYGYNKFDNRHKSPQHFVRLLASAAAKGGNILLNIGPKGDGTWDKKDEAILNGIGSWMRINGQSIYGTTKNPLPIQSWGEITQKADTLFLHVFEWPNDGKLTVGGLNVKVKSAILLADIRKKALQRKQLNANDLVISLAKQMPDTLNTVIKLELESKPENKVFQLLSATNLNKLLVFDAKTPGKGFSYGDGKRDREFATNWINKEQYLLWEFRTNKPGAFELKLAYNTALKEESGEVELEVDGKKISISYKPSNARIESPVGSIQLEKGNHTMKLSLVKFEGAQAMQPLYVTLCPAKK
ncbi:MAG: alpha-L-fucosidase [Prolixibacteraceae bacterium]